MCSKLNRFFILKFYYKKKITKKKKLKKKMEEESKILPPNLFDYSLIKPLGSGKDTTIGLYESNKTGRKICIKIIPKNLFEDPYSIRHFVKKLEVLKSLDHPSILACDEYQEDSENFYVMTRYLQRGDLAKLILTNGAFSETVSKNIIRQLASAISYLHYNNIAHKDIMLENILLDNEFNVVLTNLCHSVLLDHSTHNSMQFQWSLLYASPELLHNNVEEPTKVDMWALGVVLYAIAAGKLPWSYNRSETIQHQIEECHYTLPIGFSPELCDLILHLMTKDACDRLTADQVLNHIWMKKGRRSSYTERSSTTSPSTFLNKTTNRILPKLPVPHASGGITPATFQMGSATPKRRRVLSSSRRKWHSLRFDI